MHNTLILTALVVYTALLFVISHFSSRKADNRSFYRGDKKTPWPVIAYGMLGTSVSGVTFISVPGNVLHTNFYYMPLVLGFFAGYLVISTVLLPLYYKMNLISIYGYLESRLGKRSYSTGAVFFMISRILGATVRVFLIVLVLHTLIPGRLQVPFLATAVLFMLVIFLYTYKGGVKTIVWTDTMQTTFTILAVVLTVVAICSQMGWSFGGMTSAVLKSDYSQWLNKDIGSSSHYVKQFLSGMFLTIATVGLDQGMMQKNLSLNTIKNAQKNMFSTSIILVIANFMFVWLGAVLVLFVQSKGIAIADSDGMFGIVANEYLGTAVAVFFVIGLISSSFPSAAGAITALTTSFCIDFLKLDKKDYTDEKKKRIRYMIHLAYTVLFVIMIMIFHVSKSQAVIDLVYKMAGYTYGPLLGLFFFGILTKRKVRDKAVPYIAVAAPVLCWALEKFSMAVFDFGFGFTLLIVNGIFTFIGLCLFSKKQQHI